MKYGKHGMEGNDNHPPAPSYSASLRRRGSFHIMSTKVNEVVEHFFREESGKLASSLTRAFGLSKLDVVEDLVQDALLAAMTQWSFRGIPENPTAWLHRVAKNK